MTNCSILKSVLILSIAFFSSLPLFTQNSFTLSGYIKDSKNGETLIGATLEIPTLATGTISNEYGFYSITLPEGEQEIIISYLGYQPFTRTLSFTKNQKMDFEIVPAGTVLEEVVVSSKKANDNIEKVVMSEVKLQVAQIKKMPALMGEVDIIKAIQLLPGVQTVGEGSSGFYVRGGAVDQNLILLDEAPVYNASHLLGFFSVFNSDAIKDVQLYKGGIPANYGGRLASVLDVRMIDGNKKQFEGAGGIGTISSRLTLEGPIMKDKGSFMISGRRTYADLFLKLAKDTTIKQSQLYFYDLNAKVNLNLTESDKLFLSGYFGKDAFGQAGQFGINWGNATGTARWNHLYTSKLFSNLTVYYSDYNYFLGDPTPVSGFEWTSSLKDLSAKLDYSYFPNPSNSIRFGLQSIRHTIQPGVAKGADDSSIFNKLALEESNSWEHAAYISNEQKIGDRWSLLYGLRFSLFQNVGPFTVYDYDENFSPSDTTVYDSGKSYQTYSTLEPRMGLKYTLSDNNSIKFSYNRTAQYLQLASNSTSSSPLDIWFPSSPNVKPQISDQIAVGYFQNFPKKGVEASIELYYKKMQNAIDFKDHAQLLLNKYLEGDLRFGEARSYGMELLLKKEIGQLTGWISYTLARTERKIDGINKGNYYPTKYDKTHDFSLVLSYDMNKRINFATNWVYSTGAAVTLPTGRYEYFGTIVPVYSERNAERMPAYHRMDLSFTLKGKKQWFNGRVKHEKVISIYNVYSRKNPYSINFVADETDPNIQVAQKTYLFKILPAFTWNFQF